MPDNEVKIIFSGDASKAIPEIEKILAGMKSLQDPPERLAGATKKTGEETASALGMSRREWMRTGSEATFYLTSIMGKTGEMGKKIADATGMVTQLGESFMFGGGVGAGLALVGMGVSAIIAKVQEEQQRLAEAIKMTLQPANDLKKALDDLDKPASGLATALQNVTGVSTETANDWAQLAGTSDAFKSKLTELESATRAAAQAHLDYAQAVKQIAADNTMAQEFSIEAVEINNWSRAAEDAKWKAYELYWNKQLLIGQTVDFARSLKIEEDRLATNKDRLETATLIGTRAMETRRKETEAGTQSAQRYAQAIDQVNTAQNNMLKGMVEKALTPTTVTDEDTKATKSGTYTNKWDEFRRRIEAVTKGTNPAQFGAEFEAALAKLNMPLDVAAEKFKNFSLFADPKNLKLVDWNAMTADIGNQLLQLVGKANVMREGFSKAWASLSADQRRSLRELGIESAGDAKKVLMGAADSGVDGFASQMGDKETQKKLKGAGDQLVKTVQAGMLDKETMKIWTGGVDTLVQKIQAQFAIKENVKLLGDAGTSIMQSISEGVGKSTALADALMGAVDKAIQEAIAYIKQNYGDTSGGGTGAGAAVPVPAVPGFAGGGMGVFAKGGLVHVDTGEGYMFTGRGGGLPAMGGNVSIVYAPQVSLASQAEVTSVLEPLVNRAMRQAQARRA